MKADLRRPFRPHFLLFALVLGCVDPLLAEENGVWIDRSEGGRLHLLLESGSFELHFYDGNGNSASPDAAQGIMHCTSRVGDSRETLAILPSEKGGKTILSSPRPVRPPFQFDILLVLNFDDEEKKPESHQIVFIQGSDSENSD